MQSLCFVSGYITIDYTAITFSYFPNLHGYDIIYTPYSYPRPWR